LVSSALSLYKCIKLQAKLGAFMHEWASHHDKSSLRTVPGLLNFVKTQGKHFSHLRIVGHRSRFRETLRALNQLQRKNPTSHINVTIIVPYSPNAKHLPGKHLETLWSDTIQSRPLAVFSTVDQFKTGPPPLPSPSPLPPEPLSTPVDLNAIALPIQRSHYLPN
jgi:hypothetical protein